MGGVESRPAPYNDWTTLWVQRFRGGRGIIYETSAKNVVLATTVSETIASYRKKNVDARLVFHVSGTPFEVGFLTGLMFAYEIDMAANYWLSFMLVHIFSPKLDRAIQEEPQLIQYLYEEGLRSLVDELVPLIVSRFNKLNRRDTDPVREEIEGIAEGLESIGRGFYNLRGRLVALAYGIDYVVAEVASGRLLDFLQRVAKNAPETVRKVLERFTSNETGDFCNAFADHRNGAVFFRDFQLSNGRLFDKLAIVMVRQVNGKQKSINVTVPGLVGSMTSVNESGLAVSVNIVRSASLSSTKGIGAPLTVMRIVEDCKSVSEARRWMERIGSGVPWIFTVADRERAVVMEVIGRRCRNACSWTPNAKLVPPIPKRVLYEPADNGRNGVFVRDWSFQPSMSARRFNEINMNHLHKRFHLKRMFTTVEEEDRAKRTIGNYFFPEVLRPIRGVVIATNYFLIPEARATQMTKIVSEMEAGGSGQVIRFRSLHDMLSKKPVDFKTGRKVISFQNPCDDPTSPQNIAYDTQKDPGSTPMDGFLLGADLETGDVCIKMGFWGTGWLEMNIRAFH